MARATPLPGGRVALLFTDVEGSTALLHRLGNHYGDVLDAHDRILRQAWADHGGVEVDNEGDAFFVAFQDHDRAIAAATKAQQALAANRWPDGVRVLVRMGLHSGNPAIRGHKYWGVDVHYAARLGAAAHGGQVLLSADMRSQVPGAAAASLGRHGVKDFPIARELFHLVVDGSSPEDFPPPRTLTTVRSNLPTIGTPIIGREDVVADLCGGLTGSDRLVTLVGPGGVGKTRVAVAVGERLAGEFPEGVAFVPLAPLRDVAEVPAAIAEALGSAIVRGADPDQALTALLAERRLLVILDNAEHLSGLAPLVASLVENATWGRWLVTSRAPLNTRVETVVRLGPLEVPFQAGRSRDELELVGAAAMFLDRVRARQPDFAVSGTDRASLIRLCQVLEGVPLALELAAARAPLLGLPGLVDALHKDVDTALGTGPADLPARQRGLHATLDWTVSLLTDVERELYAACAAFAQAWTIKDAEQMCSPQDASTVWDALARLLDLSLVVQRGDGRFTMPERVRRHAGEVLSASGHEHATRVRHADVIRASLRRLSIERLTDWERAVADLGDLVDETLHALSWSAAHDRDCYRSMLAFAIWPLYVHGMVGPFVADGLAFARSGPADDLAQAYYFINAAYPLVGRGLTPDERLDFSARAAALAEECGELAEIVDAAITKVDLLNELGAFTAARAELAAIQERADRAGDPALAAAIGDYHVKVDMAAGDFTSAEARLHAIRADPPRHNYITTGVSTYLGDCAFARADYGSAISYYAEELRRLPRRQLVNVLLQVYASAAAYAGLAQDEKAVELLAGATQMWTARAGRPWSDLALAWLDAPLAEARSRLSADDLAAARRRGQSLTYEDLVVRTLALADELR